MSIDFGYKLMCFFFHFHDIKELFLNNNQLCIKYVSNIKYYILFIKKITVFALNVQLCFSRQFNHLRFQ